MQRLERIHPRSQQRDMKVLGFEPGVFDLGDLVFLKSSFKCFLFFCIYTQKNALTLRYSYVSFDKCLK